MAPVRLLERPDDRGMRLEKSGEGVFCNVFASGREMHEYTSPVPGVGLAFDEPGLFEAIESYRHSPGRQEEIFSQLGWGQGADEVELGQGFEITPMAETVGSSDFVEPRLDQVGRAQHSSPHFEWREVDVGARCRPSVEGVVESIGRSLICVHVGVQYN